MGSVTRSTHAANPSPCQAFRLSNRQPIQATPSNQAARSHADSCRMSIVEPPGRQSPLPTCTTARMAVSLEG